MKITIREITGQLEELAPLAYQESYDNAGLLTGRPEQEVTSALICLDSTEEVMEEAIRKGCNLVIAHHPIIFSGLKKITGKNYIERTIIKAIRHDIGIYAIHTNLDNVTGGVNSRICERIGLKNTRILSPKTQALRKLVTFVPVAQAESVRQALFGAGAGTIGRYEGCSFNLEGTGTFTGSAGTNPFAGEQGKPHREQETRIELIYPVHLERTVLQALKNSHPYEEVAYDIYSLGNTYEQLGSGMVGELDQVMEEKDFLLHLKKTMNTPCIRHTRFLGKPVKRVAVCGGAGSFLLNDAIASESDVFITSDFKYHQFFDADGKILIGDIGHFESEQFTKELLFEVIKKKFPTFAVHLSEIITNPVNYL